MMKKIFALLLSLMLVFSLAACGGSDKADADNSKIKEYVAEHKAELLSAMEQSFTAAGMSCDTDIEVKGMGIVISVNIDGLDDVPAEQKAQMKEAYDSMSSVFESSLELMQKDLPELEYYQVDVCEEDGDLLASIVAGDK